MVLHWMTDVKELINAMNAPWQVTKIPTKTFVQGNMIEKQLVEVGIMAQPKLHLALAKSAIKATGEYDAALCDSVFS